MKKISLFIYLLLVSIGVTYELSGYSNLTLKFAQMPNLLLALSINLIYIIPLTFLMFWYCRKKEINLWWGVLALITGLFLTGWLAAYGNLYGDNFWSHFIKDDSIIDAWSGAWAAPFIEEGIKVLSALLIAYLLKAQYLQEYLILGMGVGLGFQISEDASYILGSSTSLDDIYPQTFERLMGSVASHWLYTAIFTVSIVIIYRVVKKKIDFKWIYVLWVITPVLSHFIWNSPFNVDIWEVQIVGALITAITLYIGIDLYQNLDSIQKLSK